MYVYNYVRNTFPLKLLTDHFNRNHIRLLMSQTVDIIFNICIILFMATAITSVKDLDTGC